MIKLNALALLEKKGQSKYWLYKQLGQYRTEKMRNKGKCGKI